MKRTFDIFGDPVEMVIFSEQTGGAFSIGRQTCRPGGGPPPHRHTQEDEVFSVISGRFEVYDGDTETWTEIAPQGVAYAPCNHVHTFRNCGDGPGTIQFISSGDSFDRFLVGLSDYKVPDDLQAMIDYTATFGIFYPTLPPPTAKA